jgi:hypothetical protein
LRRLIKTHGSVSGFLHEVLAVRFTAISVMLGSPLTGLFPIQNQESSENAAYFFKGCRINGDPQSTALLTHLIAS